MSQYRCHGLHQTPSRLSYLPPFLPFHLSVPHLCSCLSAFCSTQVSPLPPAPFLHRTNQTTETCENAGEGAWALVCLFLPNNFFFSLTPLPDAFPAPFRAQKCGQCRQM